MELRHLIDPKADEKIIFKLRRHPIVFLADIAMILIIAAIPMVSLFFLSKQWPDLMTGPMSRPTLILTASAYYLMVWLFFITTFVDYYLDIWIVTNYRIVNVEQHSLFNRTISELDLTKIQDVTSEVKGVIQSILGFGNVYIQTAGEKERFIFEQIHAAHDIRKKLLDLVDEDRRKQIAPITDHLNG
jgi:uncharacterized membrane protein YdbT with pleckstrin-like domain